MKVLRITPHFFRRGNGPVSYDPVGGLQTQVWRLTEELDRIGVRQTVVTSRVPGDPQEAKHGRAIHVKCVGIPLPESIAHRWLNFTWCLGVSRFLLFHVKNFDLVHLHYNHSIWCRVLAMAAKQLGAPVVATYNTQLWVDRRGDSTVANWVERKAARFCRRIITLTTRDTDRTCQRLNVPSDRILVVPDAIDPERFRRAAEQADGDTFRRRFSIPEHKPIVAYIGRIRAEKGWQDFPAIVERLRAMDAFLLIAGDGPDRHDLERALGKSAASDRWCVTGFLTPAVPAIAYDVGGVREVAGDPYAIRLVPPSNRQAFLDAITRLLFDEAQRDELVRQGRKRVNDFSISRVGRQTLELYESLLCPSGVTSSAVDS